MRRAARLLLILVVGIAVALAAAGLWGWRGFVGPGPLAEERVVVLPRGAGVETIGRVLADAGVIERASLFAAAAWLTDRSRALKAGEYRFAPSASLREVLDTIAAGRTVLRRLTVPEGYTVRQVVRLLETTDVLTGEIAEPPDEGSLLPETYFYSWGDSRAEVLRRMRTAMAETLAGLWAERAPGLPLQDPAEALVLASIIEKETAVDAERARVAGVFVNRLRRGMRLQSDPTVIYAVSDGTGELDRALTRADLDTPHPYNTYRQAGLPPGPIANPGRASLAAALKPADTDELYFVADGTGGHVFARTLAEHQRNVARWRRLRDGAN